ncbi:MAG TPA: basic amino acid/polyamine antiporter [Gemmatimonadales bacterium]|nr:basic amino acid/polyamine antiporter [Gemmatimonadales bacterium]
MTTQAAAPETTATNKVSVPTLTAMVVGSMVGAGVFSLPARFGVATGAIGAVIAWVVAGLGMLMLAFVFQNLAVRKPKLNAGIFAYAKAGFGDYVGFNSAFGYWASATVGNCFYWVFIMTTIGKVAPAFGKGDTVLAVSISTVCVWLFAYLIARGVKEAAGINRIVTYAKLVPIIVFILIVGVAAIGFSKGEFRLNLWGGETPSVSTLFSQVKATMLITTFVFLGIEGATVYSRYAKRREDIGRATVLGFLSVLCLFALVTLVSYGVLPREQLATAQQPSMASVLGHVVGQWGSAFISVGLIVSVLGAYLAWTLMAAEILFIPATDNDMPKFLKRENRAGAPIAALVMTSAMVQLFLVVTLLSEDAFNFLLDLATSLSLFPYLFAAAYALKLTLTRETYREGVSVARPLVVAGLATIFALFLIYSAGAKFILFSCIIYAAGTVLYLVARRETGQRLFRPFEAVLCGLLALAGIAGVVGLVTGAVTI